MSKLVKPNSTLFLGFLGLTVCFLFLGLIFPPKISAQTQAPIVITEVMPNPVVGVSEWVKLFNIASQNIDLSGWILEDVLTSPSVIYTFASGAQIAGGEYVTVSIASKLNNTGDGVTLKNNWGEVIDSMTYESSAPGVSWQREVGGSPTPVPTPTTTPTPNAPPSVLSTPTSIPSFFPTPTPIPSPTFSPTPTPVSSPTLSPTPTPTPTPSPSPTPTATPQPFSHDWPLKITEIMSCPIAPDPEWFKITNQSSQKLTLENFLIQDQNSNQLKFSVTLEAKASSIIELDRNILNNTGDKLFLLAPDNWPYDLAEIPACTIKGESFVPQNGQNGEWVQTSEQDDLEPSPSPASSSTANFVLNQKKLANQADINIGSNNNSDQNLELAGSVLGLTTLTQSDPNYSQNLNLGDDFFAQFPTTPLSTPQKFFQLNSSYSAKTPTIFAILGGTLLMLGAVLVFYVKNQSQTKHLINQCPTMD